MGVIGSIAKSVGDGLKGVGRIFTGGIKSPRDLVNNAHSVTRSKMKSWHQDWGRSMLPIKSAVAARKLAYWLENIGNPKFAQMVRDLFYRDPNVPSLGDNPDIKGANVDLLSIAIHDLPNPKESRQLKVYWAEPKGVAKDDRKDPVILVHGARTTGISQIGLTEKKIEDGHEVMIAELGGFGVNENIREPNEESWVNEVHAIIRDVDYLRPGRPKLIFGHSFGTSLMLQALVKLFKEERASGEETPVPRLVLLAPPDNLENVMKSLLEKSSSELAAKGLDVLKAQDQVKLDRAIEEFSPHWNSLDSMKELMELNAERRPENRIQNICIIHGENDPYIPSSSAVNLAKAAERYGRSSGVNVNLNVIPGAGHFDMDDQGHLPADMPLDEIARSLEPQSTALVRAIDDTIANKSGGNPRSSLVTN